MSRSDLREDSGRPLERTSGREAGRSPARSQIGAAIKRDAGQFLNTAEYEFRKVVGAPRSLSKQPAPEQPLPAEIKPRQSQKPKEDSDES